MFPWEGRCVGGIDAKILCPTVVLFAHVDDGVTEFVAEDERAVQMGRSYNAANLFGQWFEGTTIQVGETDVNSPPRPLAMGIVSFECLVTWDTYLRRMGRFLGGTSAI